MLTHYIYSYTGLLALPFLPIPRDKLIRNSSLDPQILTSLLLPAVVILT